MPIYEYQCKACEHYFTEKHSMDDMYLPQGKPCPSCDRLQVQKILTGAPGIGDTVRMGLRKPDDGFKEVLQKIHEKTPGSRLKDSSSYI